MTKSSEGRKARRAERKVSAHHPPSIGTPSRRFLGTTPGPQMDIPIGQLGHPGSLTELLVAAQIPSSRLPSDEHRLMDTSEREFEVAAVLSKTPDPFTSLNFNFAEEDGGSYLGFTFERLQIDTQWGRVFVNKNAAGEASLVTMKCKARSWNEAFQNLQLACSTFLDHWAYENTVPIYLGKMRAKDTSNEVEAIRFNSPFRQATIQPLGVELPTPLRPMFALYREGLCASSPLYKFLCFYKILEGYFERQKPHLGRLFRESGLAYPAPKEVVPDHEDMPDEARKYVGKSISRLRDDLLTPNFRNAVAHFGKDGEVPTVTSDPNAILQFGLMALPTELCARVVIEALRLALKAAASAGLNVSSLG